MSDRNWRAYTLLSVTLMPGAAGLAADLPQPCIAGSCGSLAGSFVTSGNATAVQSSNTLRVDQTSDKAILNWASFDVAAGKRVEFHQPDANSVALNRIFQASPSRIFGTVEANGQIYLINQNGILFGQGARINTAGLIASTLDIADSNFERGILAPELLLRGGPDGSKAALSSDGRAFVVDTNGQPVLGADGEPLPVKLVVEQGAQVTTQSTGQRILLASRTVENSGKLSAPEGQVVLAAGEKVYLQASRDPALRGLVVEVDAGGTAWNRLTGEISASAGNVTLVGLAVNQDGRASATTTVSANGSIRLLARDGGNSGVNVATNNADGPTITASRGGTLSLGGSSVSTITPDAGDAATAVDEQEQLPSTVELSGQKIFLDSGAAVVAPGGAISLRAQSNPNGASIQYDPEARIRVKAGVLLDASGTEATAPASRNVVAVELRANELRDAPVQRDGPLRGQTVYVDARTGTPLADVSGAIANIQRTVQERTSAGGTVGFASDGDVVVQPGATVDVSGGQIAYQPGLVQTTQLITANGKVVDIGQASPDVLYASLINPSIKVQYDRWGVSTNVAGAPVGRFDPGYIEGRNGGTLSFTSPVQSLGGQFLGRTVIGDLQLTSGSAPRGSLLRIGDPTGGGSAFAFPDFRSPAINLVSSAPLLAISDSVALPAPRALDLPVGFLTTGGFTRAELYSNGAITLGDSRPLTLSPGTSLSLTANRVEVLSDITAQSGTLAFTATQTNGVAGAVQDDPGLRIGGGVKLDVSGGWTNDFLDLAAGFRSSPAWRNGGSIRLSANSLLADFSLGDSVSLLANGGAQRLASGRLTGGTGGSISISGGLPGSVMQIGNGVNVEAFGVNGAGGGSFSFEATRVEIANGIRWIRPGTLDTNAADGGGAFRLGTSLFSGHGFSTVNVTANGPATDENDAVLSVLSGTNVFARARELLLTDGAAAAPTGTPLALIASPFTPESLFRKPFSLNLAVRPRDFTQVTRVGALDLASGSLFSLDPRSSATFSGVGGVRFAGTVLAPSGTVSLLLPTPPSSFDTGYLPDLRLNLLPGARIDVSGSAQLTPNDTGLLQGSVLPGGSIRLLADRGGLTVQSGAELLANGTSAVLDVQDVESASGYRRETVASSAGSIELRAPEWILAAGRMQAQSDVGTTGLANGGSLSVQLTRQRGFALGPAGATFSTTDRVLRLTDGISLAGTALPEGQALVSQQSITAGGFDSVLLEADTRVELDPTVNLSLGRRLTLDTPDLLVRGDGNARLAAPYVSLGRTLTTSTAVPTSGAGSLAVSASLIDLTGQGAVSGTRGVSLTSSGDIRARGVEFNGTSSGSFASAGNIELLAQRLFPTTLSAFSISSGSAGAIRLRQNGASTGIPLSAGGSLQLNAADILQAGTLLAPFGRISLNATRNVTLASGSLTSVASDKTTPFGSVALGEWQYDLGGMLVAQDAIPVRRVDIAAPEVRMDTGSTLDLSGGGDLYAHEWTPGTGGSRDALSATLSGSAGRYAILPSTAGQSGIYDPQEFAGSGLRPGDSVFLAGSALLPEGRYQLLPARYALLPGAVLIEVVPKFTGTTLDSATSLADGTPVVAGRRTFLDTGIGDTQFTGFAVRSGEQARQLALYADHLASSFFPDRATRLEAARASRPADAAALGLNVSSLLDARGAVKTAGAAGGLGASVDVAAPRLQIHAGQPGTDPGAVQIAASTLNQWRPSSLMLGATRGGATNADAVSLVATDVHFDPGVNLSLDELITVARDSIRVDEGANLQSAATLSAAVTQAFLDTPATLGISGPGAGGAAVMAVSDLRRLQVGRTGSPDTQGTVQIASTASVGSKSALLVDAPGGADISGTLRGDGAAWNLASSRVSVADTARAGEFTLTPRVIDLIGKGRSVSIASSGTIDFHQSASLGGAQSGAALSDLTLSAVALRAMAPEITVAIDARDRVSLLGASGIPATQAGTGASLRISAAEILAGPGEMSVQGFDSTTLRASASLRGDGNGALKVDGSLNISAPLLTSSAGANTTFASTGNLSVSSTGSIPAATSKPGLGGAVTLQGSQIDFSSSLLLPSGLATLSASQSLNIGDGARIDVAGTRVSAAGETAAGHSGAILLSSGTALTAAPGASLVVGSSAALESGRLSVSAGGTAQIEARLTASGTNDAAGGQFDLRAGSLPNFAALNRALEDGGFRSRQDIRVDSGDLVLGTGERITARQVGLTADGGAVRIEGTIDAHSANERASVSLFGTQGVTMSATGTVNAVGIGEEGRGGIVSIGTSAGAVNLARGSTIAAGGEAEDGRVLVRAPVVGNDARIDTLGSRFADVDRLVVEPYIVVSAPATVGAAQYSDYRNTLSSFIDTAAPGLLARLGMPDGVVLELVPGLEIARVGDLSMAANDFGTWRFAGAPANITARATGSISVAGTLSDGFSIDTLVSPALTDLMPGPSGSFSFAAGSLLTSANPLALSTSTIADFRLANNAIVRTTTGDLRIAAARDLIFGTGSSLYTAGLAGFPSEHIEGGPSLLFPVRGGQLLLNAGRDLVGAPISQEVGAWQPRRGGRPPVAGAGVLPTQWAINVGQFRWNAGTLGGGDLSVRAGRDVLNLSAAAADSAAATLAGEDPQRFRGGVLNVASGRDISSLFAHVTHGNNLLRADGALGRFRPFTSGAALGSLLSIQEGSVTLRARTGIALESAFNPTGIAQPGVNALLRSFFYTYDAASKLDAVSAAGTVALEYSNQRLAAFLRQQVAVSQSSSTFGLSLLPPSVRLHALSGDIRLVGGVTLFASDRGQLDLFAARDITTPSTASITMSDASADSLPSLTAPSNTAAAGAVLTARAASARHDGDALNASIVAGRDLLGVNVSIAKPADVHVGRDIVDASVLSQNLAADDVTSIVAGRDIRYSSQSTTRQIEVGGPGQLAVIAGRDVDLGFSRGISTIGSILNPNLAGRGGAELSVVAGMGPGFDARRFVDGIVAPSVDYSDRLVEAMRSRLASSPVNFESARAAFLAMDADAQVSFLSEVFFAELVKSGREVNADPALGFDRGYAAIDALAPGSRPAEGSSASSPYSGDIRLAFSRIYTLDGGTISLFAPGGLLNVGLANPPANLPVQRKPSDLGIVAQGTGDVRIFTGSDVLVNQSRVFTLGGGDIAVWSTLGDIDAGRGAKSAISAPPPRVVIDAQGTVQVDFGAAVAGSGIRTILTGKSTKPGDVDLIAPAGVVNAGDAGIGSAGNVNVAAQQVVGLDNIQFGGSSTGVPSETSSLGASLSGASAASAASASNGDSAVESRETAPQATPLAQTALTWLDVFVEGFGEETCKPTDEECLRRNRKP